MMGSMAMSAGSVVVSGARMAVDSAVPVMGEVARETGFVATSVAREGIVLLFCCLTCGVWLI